MDFPKMNSNRAKGMSGQAYFEYLVYDKLNCIFHPVEQECDFGIDGYIELKKDNCATGKLVAVQIKHGDSFFNCATDYGYKFKGNNKHLNYYLNSNIPVFIIIMDNAFKNIYWVKFETSKILPYGNEYW